MKQQPDSQRLDIVQLIAQHQSGVWRYLRVIGCEATLADDITQETFLKLYNSEFEQLSDAATASYLRRIAFNLYISYQRRAGRTVLVDDISALDTTWQRWAGSDNGDGVIEKLNKCMEFLADRAREALHLRFSKQRSRKEIAQSLDITEHGARNLMQRAKAQLKDCVEGKINSENNIADSE